MLLKKRTVYFLWPSVPSEMTAVICLLLGLVSTVLTSVSERDFIEGRRRALGRFINLVACHPFFSEDELVKTFLTFSGSVCSFFSFKIHIWLGLNSIPLVLMFDSCTMCIIIMMNDSQHFLFQLLCVLFHSPTPLTHPSLCFLQDVQTKLRDTYKKTGDEFMTNRIATLAKVCHVGKKVLLWSFTNHKTHDVFWKRERCSSGTQVVKI